MKKYKNKVVSIDILIELLKNMKTQGSVKEEEIFNTNIFTENLISHKKTTLKDTLVFDFKEQYIRTFYNDKYYKIIHCNAFIKIVVRDNKITDMYIYPYEKYDGINTKLFDNPYPNMYSGNRTCMGSADKVIKENYQKTILSVLETAYTHSNTGFKDSNLKNTVSAFQYLTKNKFPYDKLIKTKKTLRDII